MTAWTLIERIGSGSTGEVWRVQRPDGYIAALKQVIDPTAENQRRSLKAEAAVLARLSHPHIPSLLDSDLDAERPYLVMTLAEGEALNVLIASGALWEHPLSARLSALDGIADAVMYLHAQAMIHRDIKPSNMRGLAHPLLLDFGLACQVGAVDDPDAGTFAYMPPMGEPPSPATDCYAFAISAYHLLFGAHPSRDHHRTSYQTPQDRDADAAAFASGDWRRPTLLTPSSIPGDLRGANFAGLEALFIPAFSADVTARPFDLRAWVGEIRACCEVSVRGEIVGTIARTVSVFPSGEDIPFVPPPALPDFTAQQAAGFDDTRPPAQRGWWAKFLARFQIRDKPTP